jgi:hypothetical protein
VNIPPHFALDIHHQPHLLEHQTAEQYLDAYAAIQPDNEEDIVDRAAIVATGELWEVYLWTSTLGHYYAAASTLEGALGWVSEMRREDREGERPAIGSAWTRGGEPLTWYVQEVGKVVRLSSHQPGEDSEWCSLALWPGSYRPASERQHHER